MTKIKVNNVQLYYQSQGNHKETLVFSHGFLMNNTMFNGQIDVFKKHFRCISYDHRGHGRSGVPNAGYELDNLVKDGIAFIEALGTGPVHFAGLSTGGYVGMRIAIRRPDLLKSLILMDTSATAEDAKKLKKYNLLITVVKYLGWRPVIKKVLSLLFSKEYLRNRANKKELQYWKEAILGHEKRGIIAFGRGIFNRTGVLEQLRTISTPTAVIVGEHDLATPPKDALEMVDAIPDALFYEIAGAAHSSTVEKPLEVVKAMKDFYQKTGFLSD